MSARESILLVGGGNMGRALLRGWLADGRSPETLHVVDPDPGARAAVEALDVPATAGRPAKVRPDAIILAVKPYLVEDAVAPYLGLAGGDSTFVSIAAGKTIGFYEDMLGTGTAIVRGMPNTPAAIGQGMTVLVANQSVDDTRRQLCESLMAAVGQVAWVEDEGLIDSVTAVSGSGPAYVFLLIECLTEAAVEVGLDRPLAERLALTTVSGAGAYASASDVNPGELRRQVTSPGGTTQAALEVLAGGEESHAFRSLLGAAVKAARDRSRELG